VTTGASGAFGPVVVRRRLGAALRRLREDANMRLEQVATELEVSTSKISRLETGQSIAKTWDVRNLLTVYGVESPEQRDELLRWVEESRAVGWWHPFSDASPTDLDYYISLEQEAESVSQYSPLIPGLLQTRAYARAALAEMLSDLEEIGEGDIDGFVDIRMRRQSALGRSENPLIAAVVLDEAALVRSIGDPEILQGQLRHLLDLENNVELRVRRHSAPMRRFALSPFVVFVPRLRSIDRTVVNIEAAGRDYYLEEQPDVAAFEAAFRTLWNDSLTQRESVALISALVD
jgi:transcriptional regulator with XRE-family HTH domain